MIQNERKPTELKTSDFDYELPEELIAQHPAARRDDARLMVLDRKTGEIKMARYTTVVETVEEEGAQNAYE